MIFQVCCIHTLGIVCVTSSLVINHHLYIKRDGISFSFSCFFHLLYTTQDGQLFICSIHSGISDGCRLPLCQCSKHHCVIHFYFKRCSCPSFTCMALWYHTHRWQCQGISLWHECFNSYWSFTHCQLFHYGLSWRLEVSLNDICWSASRHQGSWLDKGKASVFWCARCMYLTFSL